MGLLDRLKTYFVQDKTVIKYHETQIFESFTSTYESISVLSRCVDLIVDTAATIQFRIMEDIGDFNVPGKHKQFSKLLDNPTSDFGDYDFWRNVYRDLLFSGNAFLYNIGTEMQLLNEVGYTPDNSPTYGDKKLETQRLIHTRLLPDKDSQLGKPYLLRIEKELDLIAAMLSFQSKFFKNNGIPGVILSSENPLSLKQKERIAEEYLNMYSIMKGNAGKPFIADNNLKVEALQHSLKDLEFNSGVTDLSERICTGLGVPAVLLASGNNANITMNYKMFVFTTVYPLVLNVCANLTSHLHEFYNNTGKLKIVPNTETLPFLEDDYLNKVNSIKTLVTTGLLTINEGRTLLHYKKSDDEIADRLLPPANITGNLFEPSPGQQSNEE